MFILKMAPILIASLLLFGCPLTPLEKSARDLVEDSQETIQRAREKHLTECTATPINPVCVTINKGLYGQNVLIDAAEAYCQWPARPTAAQLAAKKDIPCKRVAKARDGLQSAVNSLNALMGELKGAAQ